MRLTEPRDGAFDLVEIVAEWRNATDETRDRALVSACAFAAQALATRADRERVLSWTDPVPEENRKLIERLRCDARAKR